MTNDTKSNSAITVTESTEKPLFDLKRLKTEEGNKESEYMRIEK